MAEQLTRLDRDALGYASCRHLPSQFACHVRSPEAIIATLKKDELKERCKQLGRQATGSLSQMVMAIADALVVRAQPLPHQFVSLNSISAGGDAFRGAGAEAARCWLCGSGVECVSLGNVADFQVGSWPPGDPRRWQFGGSCVIPVLVCQGYGRPADGDSEAQDGAAAARDGEGPAPARRPYRAELPRDVLEMRTRLYRKSSHRLPCKVGDFPTISAVFWGGQWRSLDEALTLCTGEALSDSVIPCPQVAAQPPARVRSVTAAACSARRPRCPADSLRAQEPCLERVCLQVLNWSVPPARPPQRPSWLRCLARMCVASWQHLG